MYEARMTKFYTMDPEVQMKKVSYRHNDEPLYRIGMRDVWPINGRKYKRCFKNSFSLEGLKRY